MNKENLIDFFLTYGWALIVIIVALGAVVFFALMPKGASSCTIDSNIGCEKWAVTNDGNITLTLVNNMDKDLTSIRLEIGNCSKTYESWPKGATLGGNTTTLTGCDINAMLYKRDIKITYKAEECVAYGELNKIVS